MGSINFQTGSVQVLVVGFGAKGSLGGSCVVTSAVKRRVTTSIILARLTHL